MKSVEHPSLEVIRQPFTAHIIPKWLVICKDQYNIYIQNMANANCGGDVDVMIAQLTIILMVNPSHFPDQCCYPGTKLLQMPLIVLTRILAHLVPLLPPIIVLIAFSHTWFLSHC